MPEPRSFHEYAKGVQRRASPVYACPSNCAKQFYLPRYLGTNCTLGAIPDVQDTICGYFMYSVYRHIVICPCHLP